MSVSEAVRVIQQALQKGNYGQTDLLSRHMMEAIPGNPWPRILLSETALRIGEIECARSWAAEAGRLIENQPDAWVPEVSAAFQHLSNELNRTEAQPCQSGYLLIKSWGYGLWSDVEHVLSSLLLAEMTNRIPIIHWGINSYYIDEGTDEAFGTLFEPIAPLTMAELAAEEGEIFPPKYHRGNLDAVGLNIWEGSGSRLSGLYLLNRPERIVVSDFFTQIAELLPWLRADHWLSGTSVNDAIQLLYEKYLVPKPDIRAGIDGFIAEHFTSRPVLGVHIRNIDKASEDPGVVDGVLTIRSLVDHHMTQNPNLRLFLLTDAEHVVKSYEDGFGERVFHIDCARTRGLVPLTWRNTDRRRQLGVEVITDTYLAAECDYFIGHGSSNVACMVACLKRWKDGTIQLIGDNVKTRRNWLLHDW